MATVGWFAVALLLMLVGLLVRETAEHEAEEARVDKSADALDQPVECTEGR